MAYELAQLNIARFRLPAEDPVNADFMNALDQVNAIADEQPGFVWRLQGEGNSAIDLQAFDDPHIAANMSVWTDLDSLAAFAYRHEAHRSIMRRRKEWFETMEFYLVLWWVEAGKQPTLEEAKARLEILRQRGPTKEAFTFKNPFPAPGETHITPVIDECA